MRLVLVLLAVMGLGGFWAISSNATPATAPSAPAPVVATTPATDPAFPHAFTDRVMGNADAPVTIVEYFALTCPHCGHFHMQILPEIKTNYIDTGKVRIIFRDFPFNPLGLHAAMAARCIDPQYYFDFVHTLFSTQTSWAESDDGETIVRQMAGFAGLSPEQYAACTASKPLEEMILNGRVKATNETGVNSTPSFLFEGTLERIVGAQDYAQFAAAIDRQLAKVQTPAPAPTPATPQ
jgi:protein-disulfide isomerase